MADKLTELEYLRAYRNMSLSVLNKYMVVLINEHVRGDTNKSIPEEYDFDE
jgi:hypothetical protein